jgi:erythritol kinase
LRSVIAAAVGSPARVSSREEAGAAGAAMIAAVAIGVYEDVNACIAEWVTPLLGPAEAPDSALVDTYARMFPAYLNARLALEPVWNAMAERTSGAMN